VTDLLTLDLDDQGEVLIATFTGELDISNSPSASERVIAAVPNTARALVVDFSRLDFLDSSGVSMLFRLARHLGAQRQALHVVAPAGEAVNRVLEIVEFGKAAPVHPRLEDALAAARR
jgi:anti-anti-sigma factor